MSSFTEIQLNKLRARQFPPIIWGRPAGVVISLARIKRENVQIVFGVGGGVSQPEVAIV